MSSELMRPIDDSGHQEFLNTDGSPCTWVTPRSKEERLKSASKPALIGGLLSFAVWALQYSNGALGTNWQYGLWPLGIGAILGFFGFVTKEVRHYSTVYVAYTKKQRLARAWKWWAIPLAMCLAILVLQYFLDQLADYWMNSLVMLIFCIPGFGLYMLKGERVLTPSAAAAKSEIEAAALRDGAQKSQFDEALEALLEIVWVRYPLALGCFWVAYWMADQEFKKPYVGVMASLFFAGVGIYFAREVSKWLLGFAAIGLVIWAVVAGLSALSIPVAIILGALIIAGSSSRK